ncbi:Serine/threonine-protein kinase tel1 [Sporothrix curviconia]|uniref:Serine/threonine-protein kinase TEL1 n=1 Tax=Sporothrix curviconia TaxID=1260050 RepID=A0ABP0B0S8_9PEZI
MAPRSKAIVSDDAESIRASIVGGNSTERLKALQDLISLFTRKLQGSTQLPLDAKAYHSLVEALFQCSLSEKKSYLSNKRTTKSTAESRLVASAEALRLAVNYGAAGIKRKVARAIVDHITQTLPGRDHEFVQPILQDYTKALVSLLSHPANVEQLGTVNGEGWHACASFFVDAIGRFAEVPADRDAFSSRASPAPGTLSLSAGQSRPSASTLAKSRATSQASSKILETLVQGMYYLVSASNAPLKAAAPQLANAALRVLQMRQLGVGTLQQMACASIRCIVQHRQGDDAALVQNIVREIMPLLGHWWHPRSSASQSESVNSIREEILRTIYTLQLHIEALALHSPADGILDHVRDVLDNLWMEYAKRDDRTRLQIVDLAFSFASTSCFDARFFGLSTHDVSAERRWAVVEVIAILEAIYARYARHAPGGHSGQEAEGLDDQPRKRRRVGEPPSRVRVQLASPDAGTKLAALQVLPFYLQMHEMAADDLSNVLQRLAQFISDKQAVVCSWAMLACASCTHQLHAKDKDGSLAGLWGQIWQIAARSVSLPATSRAACALLHTMLETELIPYHTIGDDINILVTAAEVSGPALLVDSSLVLMLHLFHVRNTTLPSASETTASHILRWLFSRWKPFDLSFASVYSALAPTYDIVNLVSVCAGSPVQELRRPVESFGGPIKQTWKDREESDDMMRYLLLLPPPKTRRRVKHATCQYSSPTTSTTSTTLQEFRDPASSNTARNAVLELLQPNMDEFLQMADAWNRKGGESVSQISSQRMQSLASFCIVCACLSPQLGSVNSSLARDLEPQLLNLVEATFKALHNAEQNRAFFEVWLSTIHAHLPQMSAAETGRFTRDQPVLLKIVALLSQALEEENAKQSSLSSNGFMEIDDGFDSAISQGSVTAKPITVPRQAASLSTSSASFFLNVSQRLHLLFFVHEDANKVNVLPEGFLDQFLALSNEDLLLCSDFMRDLFGSDLVVVPEDALKIVEVVGDIIGEDEYSCCEIALTTCIEVMQGFVSVWPDEKLDVSARIDELYTYLVHQSLPKNSLSTNAQVCLARLLYRLLEVNPTYGSNLGLPSCRSTLLSILQTGSVPVKYFVAMNLPKIFALYVLKVHDELFVDILESLPSDPAWPEGISFRLLALAELARSWPTLLRRCIYHIFETPGRLKQCAGFAARCLAKVATALALDSPRDLFKLFAPQLLYTWLEHDKIEDVPYEIFGFSSLDDLIAKAAQTEAVALMLMRGQETEAFAIAARLNLSNADLVQRTFAKVTAYSIAHDVAMTKDKSQTTAESRIRKVLGRDRFVEAIYHNLADIVAILFDIIDQEDPIERYFAKDPALKYAADIMAEIKTFNHSPVNLPPNQQPMFKAKYLTRELAYICSRTEYDLNTLWTPALVVSVARKLFNTIRPALGSLHACAVIRKVRVLICLAGEQATGSYPLEMLLHAVRPFVQDAECADDALGITKYLVTRGAGHLTQYPSFYAGYALSMLASLRMFLESSQASTTQESQFKATMSKAQHFHGWFAKHLRDYDSPAFVDNVQRTAFRSITQSATQIRASGNAERGTPESTLLLEIFKDGEQDARLLNDSARDLVLGMLCSDFHVPASIRADIIETDQDAQAHGAVVWKSCGATALSKEYLIWAGRVVGRSFAASGTIHKDLLRESRLDQYQGAASSSSSTSTGSEQGLLRLLETLTMRAESATAGFAESALRTIVSKATIAGDSMLQLACQDSLSEALLVSSSWGQYRTPPSDFDESAVAPITAADAFKLSHIEEPNWAQNLAVYLAHCIPDDVVLRVLPPILTNAKGFAEQAFPFIVHLVLLFQLQKHQTVKRSLSEAAKAWLACTAPSAQDNVKLLINTLVYLRTQALPNENSITERHKWLDVDLSVAAEAASRCGMFKIALLLAEVAITEVPKPSRRSSGVNLKDLDVPERTDLLLGIYENIDDPDAYYGLPQSPSLSSVLARLEYEKDGSKTLAFRGAQYDSHLRRHNASAAADGQALVQALSNIGLSGLSHSLLQTHQSSLGSTSASLDSTFTTARRLGMWNLPVPAMAAGTGNPSVTIYKAFQGVHQATDRTAAQQAVYEGLGSTMKQVTSQSLTVSSLRHHLGALAALTELDDVLNVTDTAELQNMLDKFEDRSKWMMSKQYDDVSQLLSYRETTLSTISEQNYVRGSMKVSPAEARLVEIRGLLLSSSIYRFHHAMQESLNVTTALSDLIVPSEELGLSVDAAIKMETASSLWDHGEMLASIRVLQSIDRDSSLNKQMVPVSRSDLLSKIGYQVSVARLESADSIQKKYLEPALRELKGKNEGKEAGRVFHQFAMFCDQQLQNPDGLEDLARLQSLREGKSNEVKQLRELIGGAKDSQVRHRYTIHLNKAKQWLGLDEQELHRVEQTRNEFVKLSLENYLLSLVASDEHNNDTLRFAALWLERSSEDSTNEAVAKYLHKVPTRKFAPLMNQLTSRLQGQPGLFQELLFDLVYRICSDHPYHGMYQIWSGVRTRPNQKDAVAVLRQKATEQVARQLMLPASNVASIWQAIDRTSKSYHMLAVEKDSGYKAGHRLPLKESRAGSELIQSLARYAIPPPTMEIPLEADRVYVGRVPMITRLEPTMSIASGVSAPKILTTVGSDGVRYRQLVKGGNDDLRQDAIMEQVFAAVSALLKLHRTSRQRNLGIRTYKVLPLTASSGLIEFVPNTIPLHEYLMPAHERYYPRDLKGSQCRKEIGNVQTRPVDTRISTYRKVTERFHPVMRFFFLEYFPDPDEWFVRRLAYTRATAAISMLGHVLGLGDRHGHNILLDSKTGEVVHIDLGVAFEMGRVLPVPELVPFRLTRDIVDGMGITGVEGVFRRCCEFTLDAMREETYSIMTILDVLRYDPLYSWSISPVRLAKLQDARSRTDEAAAAAAAAVGGDTSAGGGGEDDADVRNRVVVNEPSEADRALEVVRKKLSKTLSVAATVNDLINQAADERNLAVLYSVDSTPSLPLAFSASVLHPKRSRIQQQQQQQPGEDSKDTMSTVKTPGKWPDVVDLTGPSSQLWGTPKTAAAAMPTAFQPHTGARKLVIKNLRVTTPAARAEQVQSYYDKTAADIEAALQAVFANEPPRVPLERLYRGVEDLCTHGQARQLYRQLQAQVKKHLQETVLENIRTQTLGASDVETLRTVHAHWLAWVKQSTLVRSMFSYLDRAYLVNERTLLQINDMLIAQFRKMVFDEDKSSMESDTDGKAKSAEEDPATQTIASADGPSAMIGRRLVAGMCELVDQDRRNEAGFDAALLRNAVSMVHVFNVYGTFFEVPFLRTSEAYVRDFVLERESAASMSAPSSSSAPSSASSSSSSTNLQPYITACEALIVRESTRCNAFNLDSSTKKQLLHMIERVLIVERVAKLVDAASLTALIEAGDIAAVKTLYSLLRLPGLHKRLRTPWEAYVQKTGLAIVTDTAHGDEMIVRLLLLRRTLDVLVRDAFGRDGYFTHGMRDAFGRFVNDPVVAKAWGGKKGTSKVGEMVAKHLDLLLRGGLKTLPPTLLSDTKDIIDADRSGQASTGGDEDAELDRQLDQGLELFRFIQGKDVFEAFYKKDLARRLLMGRSASQDAERNMLSKLKTECGSTFTQNLEQMFRDQELSRDEMAAYRQWLQGRGKEEEEEDDDDDDEEKEKKKNKKKSGSSLSSPQNAVDLQVSVLAESAWPLYPKTALNLPPEVLAQVNLFDKYYKTKHTGRKLAWTHTLGHCLLKARFNRGVKELMVSSFQAAVLLLFNEAEEGADAATNGVLSYAQIGQATALTGTDLTRTLQSLACGKVRVLTKHPKGRDVGETDTFTVNKAFTDPKFRIKINQIQLKETKAENAATYERVSADRQYETQAAIVRIMKSRKSLAHAQLVAEVIGQTKSRGALDPADIKQSIEKLIEKDYLEREDGKYVYLA